MRKCKVCKTKFKPQYTTIQPTCSITCLIIYDKQQREKEYKARTRELRKNARNESHPWHIKECQRLFNRWVRVRDSSEGCISCGTCRMDIKYDAGHFLSVGSNPELRFHPDNCHKQCSKNCNTSLSGNVVNYRPRLIEKIGLERVEWLEGPHKAKHYTIPDLKGMIKDFKAKIKELE